MIIIHSSYTNTYPSRIDFGKIQYGGPLQENGTRLRLLVLLA